MVTHWTSMNKLQWLNFNRNKGILIQENVFENAIWKWWPFLSSLNMLFVWMSCNRQLIWYYFTGLRLCTVYLTKCVQCFTMLCFVLVVQWNVSNKAGEALLKHMNFTICLLHTSFTVVVPILMRMSYSLGLLWGIGQSYDSHINVSKATFEWYV